MDWVGDVGRGEWLRERLDVRWRNMHSAVPHGFEAYARVFHPVTIDRPAGTGTWSGPNRGFASGIDYRSVPWARVAEVGGATMHPLAQFGRLNPGVPNEYNELVDADGWRYSEPAVGTLDVAVLAAVALHLAAHTGTPDAGIAAVWEGWGGLVSGTGVSVIMVSDEEAADRASDRATDRETEAAEARLRQAALAAMVEPDDSRGPGLLPAEVSSGARLRLPGRDYVLFDAGIRRFVDPAWLTDAPWTDSTWPQSPNLIWPDDHAWALVSEIDFDSTVIAGTRALVDALVADPTIEVLELREGADLTSEGDTVNLPPN
ncbi:MULTISPECIES: hypothetical protein [Cryobacterium]|uniref:hypothetical protein n=1 Tax=Cryobacterium TaxID=69578 RepID=UPI0013FD5877|nr:MULTISPECIES: hypothetical protein [Cryobacterium]